MTAEMLMREFKQTVGERTYTLDAGTCDVARFEGDTVQNGTTFSVFCNGDVIGKIFFNGAYPGQFTNSLNKLRWSGDRTADIYDPIWHDSQPFDSLAETMADAIRRAESIFTFRKSLPVKPDTGRIVNAPKI